MDISSSSSQSSDEHFPILPKEVIQEKREYSKFIKEMLYNRFLLRQGMPAYTPRGIRQSALRSRLSDRVNDAAWPYPRHFVLTKQMYKNQFSADRIERIDRMIEAANATCYSKLANCVVNLQEIESKPLKEKRWTKSEWKAHMDYINQIAAPKRSYSAPPVKRGKVKPLDELMQRINEISDLPEFRKYRKYTQDPWYKNPEKVPLRALQYVITDRTKKLATPRVIPKPSAINDRLKIGRKRNSIKRLVKRSSNKCI